MADNFPGKIFIGGTLYVARHKPSDVGKFMKECAEQPIDWAVAVGNKEMNLHRLRGLVGESECLEFYDTEAHYGEFTELEDLCRLLNLSYDRISDAYAEYSGELVRWRPGMSQPVAEFVNQADDPMVLRLHVETCLAEIEKGHVDNAVKTLRKVLPDVAPLEPFVVDTDS
jgi:hypothetical protein